MLRYFGNADKIGITKRKGNVFFISIPFFCGLHLQKHYPSPSKTLPITFKNITYHLQKKYLSPQNAFHII
ncbi:hypothetical protein, partial [Salmonella enterica]|uniref:hypothetical protein n=1 Tax=Salmonella enterica TaxID=28901 RepID=UPI001F2362DE